MIRIEEVRFAYPGGDFALRLDTLEIGSGEAVAVIGPSGSGKSTFLNLVAGLARPQTGRVRVDDIDVSDLGERAARRYRAQMIGFIFQDFGLLDYLTARDNILHPYRVSGALALSGPVQARMAELAGRLGVVTKLGRRPADLSHGERQRVAICRALLPRPKLLLADEATGNLDPVNKTRILDILFDAAREDGATLVAVTHDHDLLPRFERVIDFTTLQDGAA